MERRNFLTAVAGTGVATSLMMSGSLAEARSGPSPTRAASLSSTEEWLLKTGSNRLGENLDHLVK